MCGIAGVLGRPSGEGRVKKMLERMTHRGPDDFALWNDDAIELGHCRLSIIDLATGKQPQTSPDSRFVLSYNGEIYNYSELRPELEVAGWKFRTASDTEVLLAGLVLHGPQFLTRTVGMFAFALWDKRERSLLLARDRMGVKPLYYAMTPAGLVFASELKSILASGHVSRELNHDALQLYLGLRFVPGPDTMVKGIQKFPQAHWAIYKDGQLRFERYWQVKFESNSKSKILDPVECEERFMVLLEDAVRLRLRADVPCGAFLSGGVDSATIVGLMSQSAGKHVHTYSIGFGSASDELEDASRIADFFETDHTAMQFTAKDFERLPELAWYLDEPFPDPIALAMFLLAEKASENVKVILTGEGADELLAGYVHHPHLLAARNAAGYAPQVILSLLAAGVRHIPVSWIDRFFSYPASVGTLGKLRLSNFVSTMKNPTENYLSYVSLFNEKERSEILSEDVLLKISSSSLSYNRLNDFISTNKNGIDGVLDAEYNLWLPDNILFKQDKTLMAHSIEGRVPFCDHRLVEFASKLPLEYKLGGGTNKNILRKAAARRFGSVISASKKAFMVPPDGAMGKAQLRMAKQVLLSDRCKKRGMYKPGGIDKLFDRYEDSALLAGKKLMALTCLELWMEQVLDERS